MDYHRIYSNRMVLSRYWTHRTHLYDWPCADKHLEGTLLVWQCMPSRQHVRPYSPHKPIPAFVRTFGFRLFMVFFIFSMFGIQLTFTVPWSEGGLAMWSGIGRVFWTIIVVTTIVGVVLAFIYAPRTWCSFCPMGTISRWVAPKHTPLPKAFTNVHVTSACQMKCKSCARVCPMQLTPYDSRGQEVGYLDPDCIKCGKCTLACPTKIMTLRH